MSQFWPLVLEKGPVWLSSVALCDLPEHGNSHQLGRNPSSAANTSPTHRTPEREGGGGGGGVGFREIRRKE